MSCTSKFSSHMTMISNFFIVIINEFYKNSANVTQLKLFFFFFTHGQFFVKVFFHYFLKVFKLFKNRLNKLIRRIFASKNNNRFTKFIINTNKLVSKTTRNVILLFIFPCNYFWMSSNGIIMANMTPQKTFLIVIFDVD